MKTITGIFKIVLFFVFIFNIIGWESFYDFLTLDKNEHNKKLVALEQFSKERVASATKLATSKQYSEDLLCKDILAIIYKQRELGVSDIPSQTVEIIRIYHALQIGTRTFGHTELYGTLDRVSELHPKIKPIIDAEKHVEWSAVSKWLFGQYKKNFILALILLLLWLIESRKGKFSFRNPFTFLLLLIFYPITLAYFVYAWVKIKAKELYAEAEIRRTKQNLFSILSKDEIDKIRQFAQSKISAKKWRGSLVSGSGIFFRHSFATALTVTIILFIIPEQVTNASMKNQCNAKINNITASISQHLPRMDTGDNDRLDTLSDFLSEMYVFEFYPLIRKFFPISPPLCIKEVKRKICHIPKMAIQEKATQSNNKLITNPG